MRLRFVDAFVVLAAGLSGTVYWIWSQPPEPMGERRIAQVAVSPSGKWYAAGSVAGRYAIWPRANPDRAQHFRIPGNTPRALAFSPDETQLVIAHNAGLSSQPVEEMGVADSIRAGAGFRVAVFQPRTGSLLAATDGGSIEWIGGVKCCGGAPGVAFSADGSMIATSGAWPALWDSRSGKLIAHLARDSEFAEFGPVAFDHARRWILMGSRDGRAYAWDVQSRTLQTKSPEPAGSVESVTALKNSPWIVFAKTSAPLHMWNPDTGEMRTLEALPYSNVLAGPQPGSVLFGNYAGSVELWNAETGAVLSRFTLR